MAGYEFESFKYMFQTVEGLPGSGYHCTWFFFLRRCWIVRTPGQKEFLYFGWGSLEINRWNLASWLSVAFNGHFFNPCFVKKKLNRETKKFKRPETISEMSKSNEVIFSSTSLPSHKVATAFVDWTYVCKCNRTCLIIKTILSMKKW